MRLFWAFLLLILLAGAAAAFFVVPGTARSPSATPAPSPPPIDERASEVAPPVNIPEATLPATIKAIVPPADPALVDFKLDLENAVNIAAKTPADAPHATKPTPPAAEGTPVELPTSEAWPAAKITPAKAVRIGNELVIDGRFRVKGAGTQKDPYIVPFELLMSAADIYDPRKGLTKMPQRVAFLHEKFVRLDGYIAFPISSTDPRQALVMFNQWDGCCIGVPPSTYDSVETNLDQAVTGDDKFITYGTTVGVLKVDPYVDNGWLLGLYLLDHATLTGGKSEPMSPKQLPEN